MNESLTNDFAALVEEIRGCTLCPLSEGRTNAVPGEGDPHADIMFIGEAPGFHEDRQGRPFVGASGGVLDDMLAAIGLNRSDVFICNMIKCRPPDNRDPQPSEMDACRPYLDRQIDLIDPVVIVTLGRHSFGKFFPGEKIGQSRGRARRWTDGRGGKDRTVFPVYHPAAILHNPRLRTALEEDFRKLPDLIRSKIPGPTEAPVPIPPVPTPAEQLGMNLDRPGPGAETGTRNQPDTPNPTPIPDSGGDPTQRKLF